MTEDHHAITQTMAIFQTEPMRQKRDIAVGGIRPNTGKKQERGGKKYAFSLYLLAVFIWIYRFICFICSCR